MEDEVEIAPVSANGIEYRADGIGDAAEEEEETLRHAGGFP